MKKRKLACLSMSVIMALGMFSSCSSNSAVSSSSVSSSKNVTIHIFMGSPEITDAVNTAIKQYKTVKPNVTIQLQVLQSDLNTVLKSKIASNNVPDVFQTTSGPELQEYAEYSADLTDTAAAKSLQNTVIKSMSYQNKVLGLPLKVDEYGILYNKDLFTKAGITTTPKTLTELEKDCKLLQGKGITAFAGGYKEWWVHKYIFQHFMAAASSDVATLADKFNSGKTTFEKNPLLLNYFKFTDLTIKYGTTKPLVVDENADISDLAGGKVAMGLGLGSWAESNIKKITPNMSLGIMPFPVSDNSSQANFVAATEQCLRVSSSSSVKNETIAFFNWLYTSDYGQKTWFPKVAKLVSPETNAIVPSGLTIPTELESISKKDKITIYPSSAQYSDDAFNQKFGETMQAYIGGNKSQSDCITQIQKDWKQYGNPDNS